MPPHRFHLLRNQTPSWAIAAALARNWELNRLADRLDELAKTAT